MAKIALIVHGGAWEIPKDLTGTCRRGVERALARGWSILENGGSALNACQESVVELEDEPVFDAGVGSHLNRDGKVQLDAIIMDGETLKSGAIVAVERIRNPIRLARMILDKSDHMMLAAQGAELFAEENGLHLCDPSELIVPREANLWSERCDLASCGTVGAVALDSRGNLASATSTGGTFFKLPGRVGDSPLVGCGCYADNLSGAVSSTGHGESIMKVVLAKTASDYVAAGQCPQDAADAAVALLARRTGGRGGLIVLDRQGRSGIAFNTPHMAYAFRQG